MAANQTHSQDVKATFSHKNMGTYKAKIIKHKTKGSQTPGKTKGGSCQCTPLQRAMAKRSRNRFHPEYGKFCKYWDSLNGNKMGSGK
jgi:hypothetical protein